MFLVLLNRGLRRSLGVGSGTSTQAGVLDFHPPQKFQNSWKTRRKQRFTKGQQSKGIHTPKAGWRAPASQRIGETHPSSISLTIYRIFLGGSVLRQAFVKIKSYVNHVILGIRNVSFWLSSLAIHQQWAYCICL